jgi:hypothetical protein
MSKDGIARAAQALAPRVAQSFFLKWTELFLVVVLVLVIEK